MQWLETIRDKQKVQEAQFIHESFYDVFGKVHTRHLAI